MTPRNDTVDDRGEQRRPARGRLLTQLGVEVVIGILVALLLVIVGWASSNAIRFVYGGY